MTNLIIEDGSIVEGANSYITVEEFLDYLSKRNFDIGKEYNSENEDSVKEFEGKIIYACEYLNSLSFIGKPAKQYRSMAFPRLGINLDNKIPSQIKEAQSYIAYQMFNDFDFFKITESNGGIQSETVGPLSTTYFNNSSSITKDNISYLNRILRDFLKTNNGMFRMLV